MVRKLDVRIRKLEVRVSKLEVRVSKFEAIESVNWWSLFACSWWSGSVNWRSRSLCTVSLNLMSGSWRLWLVICGQDQLVVV
jgi:hypothetical protein